MTNLSGFRRTFSFVSAALVSAAALLATGCGMGLSAPSNVTSASTFHGMVHGGPSPVTGATVTLYATGITGYGVGATPLGTTQTLGDGSFVFSGAGTCASPEQEYITVSGGNPGAGNNPNYLLMAALGDCSTVNTDSVIWVDEVTTVAAAYALSNFIAIGPSGTVNIGAPATNAGTLAESTVTGSCTGTGSSMACVAAGLPHAFQNALNLANSIGTASNPPTGQAYQTTPSNPNGTVPAALINALANSLEVCVNSTGGDISDTSTPCGKLFSYTTPPVTSSATPVAPTNTLQAMINVAKYPNLASPDNVTNLIDMPSGFTTYYGPALTSAANLHDLSLAITYSGVTDSSTTTAFGYPYFLALDYNDEVYTLRQKTSSGGPVTVIAMTSDGATSYAGPTVSSTACSAGVPCVAAPDTTGTLWFIDGSTSSGNLYPIDSSSGTAGTSLTVSGTPFFGVAVDKYNSVFVSVSKTNSANSFYSVAAGGTALSPVEVDGNPYSAGTPIPSMLAFDNNGNLWMGNKYSDSGYAVDFLHQTTGALSTTFDAAQSTSGGGANDGLYGLVTDSSGNAWVNNVKTLYKITPDISATPIALSATPITITDNVVAATGARYSAIDGANNIFLPDNSKSSVYQYFPADGSYNGGFAFLKPCGILTGTTTCTAAAASEPIDAPRNLAIDSTGSIWVASSPNGNVVQIIGTAAPTWGQLSYGHSGLKP